MSPARADGGRPGRGLFVSVIQRPQVLSSPSAIAELLRFAGRAGIGDIFIQVYRSNKAWFPSNLADSSEYAACRKSAGEDPLALLIRQAHARGVRVHAWINLLSLGNNKDAFILKKYGREILTRNRKSKKTLEDYEIDNQYFLEPGDLRVRAELARIVEEILLFYPGLDGVQFDYIRYPDKHPAYGYTRQNMARFRAATGREKIEEGSAVWNDWKRSQVTELLEMLVKRTRALRPRIMISTTACCSYSRAYLEAFQDWPRWLKDGLVDFVTLMSYSDDYDEFAKFVREAGEKADLSRVSIGIAAYKFSSPEGFRRQWSDCERGECRSCVVFHYGSLLDNPGMRDVLESGESQ